MEPNRVEFQKQCIFQSFCKRVLHNEACNAHEEIRRRRAKEVSFSDLALHEERQLYTLDKYFQDEEAEPSYQQAGKKITPKLLLEAIRTLPEEKRKAIMLYYFEGIRIRSASSCMVKVFPAPDVPSRFRLAFLLIFVLNRSTMHRELLYRLMPNSTPLSSDSSKLVKI